MMGYWGKPEETNNSFTDDGYFRTGDLAVQETSGCVKLVDRLKDIVIVSGFNVYPNEVEEVVFQHPDVTECAVVGVMDDTTGESVKLFVVTSSDELSEADVKSWCREKLTSYKVPRKIIFVDELPKSNVGKVLRRELRETD